MAGLKIGFHLAGDKIKQILLMKGFGVKGQVNWKTKNLQYFPVFCATITVYLTDYTQNHTWLSYHCCLLPEKIADKAESIWETKEGITKEKAKVSAHLCQEIHHWKVPNC